MTVRPLDYPPPFSPSEAITVPTDPADERRQAIISLITNHEMMMAQFRASKASYERGEPAIPADEEWADERRRNDSASR